MGRAAGRPQLHRRTRKVLKFWKLTTPPIFVNLRHSSPISRDKYCYQARGNTQQHRIKSPKRMLAKVGQSSPKFAEVRQKRASKAPTGDKAPDRGPTISQ